MEALRKSSVAVTVYIAENAGNRMGGFAKAHNYNLREGSAPYVLILNPDLFVAPHCIEAAIAAHARPLVAMVGANYRNCLWRPPDWTGKVKPLRTLDAKVSQAVPQIMGAFMLIKRHIWQQLGGFDERFAPLYYEDLDLCLRARALGYFCWHEALAAAEHIGCATTDRMKLRRRYWHAKNRLKFLWKWKIECAYS